MLTIKTLKLEGFLSYDKCVVDLAKPGITVITGSIGVGKSALLEGVLYLLYGQTLRKKGSVNNLINKVLQRGFDISLTYTSDGIDHEIREVREKGKVSIYHTKNGVTKEIQRSDFEKDSGLNMSFDEFNSRACLGQRQSQILMTGTSAAKGSLLSKIFGLSRYDNIISICGADIKSVTIVQKDLREKIESYEKDINDLKESLVPKTTSSLNWAQLEDTENNLHKVRMRLDDLKGKDQQLRDLISKQEVIQDHCARVRELDNDIEDLRARLKSKEKYRIDTSVTNKLEDKLGMYRNALDEAKSEVHKASKDLARVKSMPDACPLNDKPCPIDVPIAYKDVIQKRAKNNLETYQKTQEDLGNKILKIRTRLNNFQEYEELYQQYKQKKLSRAQFRIKDYGNLESYRSELQEIQSRISKGVKIKEKLVNKRDELLSAKAAEEERKATLASLHGIIDDKKSLLKEAKEALGKVTKDLQYMAGALSVFKKAKLFKIDTVLERLNTNVQDILDEISDHKYRASFVSQKLNASGKKLLDDVDIVVTDGYKKLPIDLWSEGQRALIGLSVLLGVWQTDHELADRGVSVLFLDEVFGPLSSDIIDRVFDTIIRLSKDLCTESVKIITHHKVNFRNVDHHWHITMAGGLSNLEQVF